MRFGFDEDSDQFRQMDAAYRTAFKELSPWFIQLICDRAFVSMLVPDSVVHRMGYPRKIAAEVFARRAANHESMCEIRANMLALLEEDLEGLGCLEAETLSARTVRLIDATLDLFDMAGKGDAV